MANWRSVMAKRSVMAREECNGHRCNKRADKEYTWKATKAAHFRGFCVSLITHHTHTTAAAHHTPCWLVSCTASENQSCKYRSDQPLAALVFVSPGSFKKPSPPPPCKSARGGVGVLRFGADASRAPKSLACEARSARRYVDARRRPTPASSRLARGGGRREDLLFAMHRARDVSLLHREQTRERVFEISRKVRK